MTPWTNERDELPAFARKHSMNQRVMKRDAELERKFEMLMQQHRRKDGER